MGQSTYRNKLRRYQRLRQNQTEQQYEYLTERHVIRPSHPKYAVLDHFSHLANNVYNQGLYRARQALFKGTWLSYNKLDASLKQSKRQKDSMIYSSMNSVHLVQQQLKLVARSMDSWNKARKAYAKNPGKFTGRPKLPKYRTKGGLSTIIVDNQTAKLRKNGYVEIPCMDKFKVKLAHPETTTIQEVRIVPQNRRFIVEVVYKTNQITQYKPDSGRYLGIDPGVNNAFTLATNVPGIMPVIVNGKPVKSVNQFYNKQRARLTSIYDRLGHSRASHRLARLDFYRNQKMNRFAHEASKRIVDFALSHGLNTIIIGKNKGQKQRSQMGKRNNQNFIGIPHQIMINLIKYKANLAGIVVIQHSEVYTSQTSFLDKEEPIRENGDQARKRKGLSPAKRRLKRGLYQTDTGQQINADVNGALQIIKKVVPNAFADGIAGIGLCPVKWSLRF